MKSCNMKSCHVVTYILIIVGALNWGLIGLFGFDLVARIFGDMSVISRIIYVLVGISAVVDIATHKKSCKACCGKSCGDCKGCEGGKCESKEGSDSVSA